MPLSPLTPADPQRLGGYWLAGRLGAGGQGVVYEAYGEEGERVAVKVPRVDDASSRARLAKEATAARRVASFCTARVVEARTDLPEPFIVSEYVAGPNLRQVIGQAGPYRGDLLLRLAIGVATALTAIHRAGIVHRDMKPDNIILGPDGPRVIDFGVARQVGLTGSTTGPIVGTPNYMAPELFAGHEATPAADVWAFGLTVLFAATGRDALPGLEPFAAVARVLDFRPDLRVLDGTLREAVAGALARDPLARPSARELLLSLLDEVTGVASGGDEDLLPAGGSVAAMLRPPAGAGGGEPDLGTLAEELYQDLSEGERTVAPEVFLRMVAAAEDSEESIRHVPREELPDLTTGGPASSLLDVYGAAGLIVEADATYTLAHPALIHAWPRLREWLAEDRAGLPVHRRLTEAARAWDRLGRKSGDLLHGSGLDRALRWAAAERRNVMLIPLERDYLDASAALVRRTSRRRGVLAATLAVLLVLTVAGGGLAEYLRRVAARERDDSGARSLALRAADLRETDPRLAMLMSVAAWRLAPGLPQSLGALYDARSQVMTDSFADPAATAATVYDLSADGRTLVTVRDGQATLWDVRAHRELRRFTGVSRTARKAALRSDGKVLAVQDDTGVRLWDVATGAPQGDAFGPGTSPYPQELEFGPSGRLLAIPEADGHTRWWDAGRRQRLRTGSGAGVDAVDTDGTLGVVASGGSGRAELWDLRSGRRLKAGWLPLKKDVTDVRFAEDGRTIAVTRRVDADMTAPLVPGSPNSPVRRDGVMLLMRSARSGAPLPGDGAGPVADAVAFGRHDGLVGTWENADLVVLRSRDSRVVVARRLGVQIKRLRFDPDGRSVRVLTVLGTVLTLDVASLLDRPVPPSASTLATALLGPGGRVLARADVGTVWLWDVRRARQIGQPIHVTQGFLPPKLAFSADGGRLAIGAAPRTGGRPGPAAAGASAAGSGGGGAPPPAGVTLVETAHGTVLTSFLLADRRAAAVRELAFAPDGATLAVAPDEPPAVPIEVWDLRRRQARSAQGVIGAVGMAYRPDGGLLVAGTSPEPKLVDPATLTPVRRPGGTWSLDIGAFAFSPDARKVAITSLAARRLSIWDANFTGPSGRAFPETPAGGWAPVWSPDGRLIATVEAGGGVRLWDETTREPLGHIVEALVADERQITLAFGPDGRTLVTATQDGVLRTHELDADRVAAAVCRRAGGPPSSEEWPRNVTEVAASDVCPDQASTH
ncbi:hypothetical protein Sme01_25020 [Sphaerisporangium melleum]|uniref:Protein kinase domain-containing protein n=1 Tax=Sphaerisporangium melleum TaxID=321316 RepID=A0A917QSB3_9ACTN|nr:WD40 repeat domain-containing serine/threonine-protein kinase [Sphaerisporangium melleum]GGK64888.1 hypothetical protein GCM10007964_04910 [Sphaerisporangium melleum]GII70026.1 hypothetical protein Sme01_25020 [Sphaerisporangium melleum]